MTTQPTQYRIRWYSGLTGQITQGVGAFPLEQAEMWVRVLNRDKDNKAQRLHHWFEPVEARPEFIEGTEAEAERRQ